MILILVGLFLRANPSIIMFIFFFCGVLVGYCLILFGISFFISTEKLKLLHLIIILGLSIPILLVYLFSLPVIFPYFFIIDQIITAFFAFKFCIDYSQKFDDFLYKYPKTRKITRLLEFFVVGAIDLIVLVLSWIFFFSARPSTANIFFIVFIIDTALLVFVGLRLLLLKKFSAYISVFFLLTLAYVSYIVISIIYEYNSEGTTIIPISILFDIILFVYIIGSVFSRVDYLKEKLRYVGADTIALFIISTKLIVQVMNIADALPWIETAIRPQRDMFLVFLFIAFTLLFGLIAIFTHKPEIDTPETVTEVTREVEEEE